MKSKKGQLDNLIGFATGIATLVVLLVVTFMILTSGKSEIASMSGNNSVEYNATVTTSSAVATIPGWLPIVVMVGIGAVLLGLVSLFKNRG